MKKIILTILILGQILMAATIQHIDVNGLKIPLIFENDKRLPIVNMQFVFTNAGSIRDIDKAGLAKLSARVMNEGTKKMGSSAFAQALETKAISISSSTGRETFVMEVSSLKEEFDDALGYFDMLLEDPNTTPQTIQKVKTITIGSLSAKENDFDYVASNQLKSIMFENTPLANPSLGTIKSIKSITPEDINNFIKTNLVSSKLIIVAGGDIEISQLKKKLSKIISKMAVGTKTELKHYDVVKTPKTKTLYKDTKQAYMYFGSPYNMDENDSDYYKARVATFILGAGGFGSRLMEEIRVKKGLAYSAYARISVNKSCSYFSGYLQTKIDSLDEAKQTTVQTISEFVKNGVTKDELEQTKKFILGSEPLRVESMSQRLSRTFMEYYKGHKLGYSLKELQKIKKLKLSELNKFIKKHTEIQKLSFSIVTAKK